MGQSHEGTGYQTIDADDGKTHHEEYQKSWSEIAAEYAKAKNTHPRFTLGSKFGFAAAIRITEKFIQLHNDAEANLSNVDKLSDI